MELFLGILQGIGIFLVFPLIVAFVVVGIIATVSSFRAKIAERPKVVPKTSEQPRPVTTTTEAHGKARV